MTTERLDEYAARILAAADAGRSLAPLTSGDPAFGLDDAARVALAVARRRIDRGERPMGWKIGFTNRTIWDEYGVHAPIWGRMYHTTVAPIPEGPVSLGRLAEPRIEPEIVLRIGRTPEPGMAAGDLMGCVDGVAHGFEIVQSLFPAWRFRAADTVAAFALHGALWHGPFVEVGPSDAERWRADLERFSIVLSRDGAEVDRGHAADVLDGPLHALAHAVRGLAQAPWSMRIEAGDLVTTGTVTRAFPVAPGQRWTTRVEGLGVAGIALAVAPFVTAS